MDQLIYASLPHTHYWYEVGMLKVPAMHRHDKSKKIVSRSNGRSRGGLLFLEWHKSTESCFLVTNQVLRSTVLLY